MIFNIAKSVMKQIVLTFLHAIIYQWKFSFMFWMKYRLFNFALHWDYFIQRSLARSLCSINCLALGLGHFVALESFHSLLVFLDEPLEFEYYCLLLETYVSSLCCNRFNSWVTILFVHFLLTCIFLVQNRFQLALLNPHPEAWHSIAARNIAERWREAFHWPNQKWKSKEWIRP